MLKNETKDILKNIIDNCINKNYGYILKSCINITNNKEVAYELLTQTIVILYSYYDFNKLSKLNTEQKIILYIIKCCKVQFYSSKSNFNINKSKIKLCEFNDELEIKDDDDYNIEHDIMLDNIYDKLHTLSYYEKFLYESVFIKNKNIHQISKELNVPIVSMYSHYKLLVEKLKQFSLKNLDN